ncbi:SprT family protein [Halalkalibacter alkalisediminis]|uniref:Protein SprT-like n=1 Tax=Halalkalibacter alkalisediminis TaxID=935616 RepID=A0ABV6NIK7_9BACI|nr:SprT family protein [Halalkalibacter alkalisediminis]
MTDDQLQQLVEQVSIDYFQWPFKHRAMFNKRLRTTGGRYLLRSHNIEINPKQLAFFGEEALIGIIKHELCHYHLHLQRRGYQHRDDDFKALMKKVGAPRFCEMIPGTQKTIQALHVYKCVVCALEYRRKRRIDVRKFVCGTCKGKLKKI